MMAVFLVGGLILFDFWFRFSKGFLAEKTLNDSGGPVLESLAADAPALLANLSLTGRNRQDEKIFLGEDMAERAGSLQDQSRPVVFSSGNGLLTYKVKKGDTLSRIASNFGISVQTILGANPQIRANSLSIGQELFILPVSGIVYKTKEGETLESISTFFNVSPTTIQRFNPGFNFSHLEAGSALIIPGVKPRTAVSSYSEELGALPDLGDYFTEPLTGFNWGQLHYYNAVDIVNNCGTPVKASAEGLIIDEADYGWNAGYGHFVLIEHPNSVRTRYAHLDKISVIVGDYVKQGEVIGTVGNTGNVHGPTGCHLHFEVIGAKNPFAK